MTGEQIFYVTVTAIVSAAVVAVVPIVGYFWSTARAVEQNAVLKKSMIDRGFAPDEIVRVLEAGSGQSVWDNQGVVYLMDKMIRQKYSAEEIAKVMRQGRGAAAPPAEKPESSYA